MPDTKSKSSSIMEKLLASQNKKLISVSRGQEVEGEVVAILDREVVLELGTKAEGVLGLNELADTQKSSLKVGDKLKAYVQEPEGPGGQTILTLVLKVPSRGPKGSFSSNRWQKIIQAKNQNSILTGQVIEINKGGLIVEVDGIRGFLPSSHIGAQVLGALIKPNSKDLSGEEVRVTVIEVDPQGNRLIFTQKGQVDEETKATLAKVEAGKKVKGEIVNILPFGLILNIEGSAGIVLISEASWERQEDLNQNFKIGQEVEAKVLNKEEDLGRINLSLKQAQEDPFTKLAQEYKVEDVVKGTVAQIQTAGVIVTLAEGVEGFLPSSKMDPDTSYEVGKSFSFLVDEVDTQRRKINLAPFVTSTAGLIYK